MNVTRRPETPEDEPFLRRLFLQTIAEQLGASAWPPPMRDHLLGIQYAARRQSRRTKFFQAAGDVILADGNDAGWIVVVKMPTEVHLVDIMVAPEFRGRGIGSAAIRGVLAAAANAGQDVRLNVNVTNGAAIRLYERLGFRRVGGDEVQHCMAIASADAAAYITG